MQISQEPTYDLVGMATEMRRVLKRQFKHVKFAKHAAYICCPFHNDRTPSLSISLHTDNDTFGSYFCFGCGAHGWWSSLASATGMTTGTSLDGLTRDDLRRWLSIMPLGEIDTTERPRYDSPEAYLRDHCPHFTRWETCALDWRGFSSEDMIWLNAYAVFDYSPESRTSELMALFPVVIFGEVKGAVRCGYGSKLYLNVAGDWRNDFGLLFFDHAVQNNDDFDHPFIVVCEGVRDAARLTLAGIPAVAMLGTQGWNSSKTHLLQIASHHAPVERFYLGTDPDAAGNKASSAVNDTLHQCHITNVAKLVLPTDYTDKDGNPVKADIAALTDKDFNALVRMLRRENGYNPVTA